MKTILIGSILALVLLSTTATAQLDCNDDSTICDTNAMCIGNYTCTCNSGYAGNGTTCTVCTDTCHDDAMCIDDGGLPVCVCNPGYTGNGTDCTDVNDCTDGSNNCHVYATCTNTPGNFTCACNSGFTGNGTTCMDVDECDIKADNCHAYATCTNTPGNFTCACNSGFTGNGTNCTDINECETGKYCQDDYAISCNNTDGGYFCTCQDGYFYYSQFAEKCIKIGNLPIRVPALEVQGCNEEANYKYRADLGEKIRQSIEEYLQAKENYGDGSGGSGGSGGEDKKLQNSYYY